MFFTLQVAAGLQKVTDLEKFPAGDGNVAGDNRKIVARPQLAGDSGGYDAFDVCIAQMTFGWTMTSKTRIEQLARAEDARHAVVPDVSTKTMALLAAMCRGTAGTALQVHLEYDRAVRFFGIEPGRHPVRGQFHQRHRNNVRGLVRWIRMEREADRLGPVTGS